MIDGTKLGQLKGDPNPRCRVYEYDNDKICKLYTNSINYENERDIYLLLKDCDFIPKLYDHNDDGRYLIIERLMCPSVADPNPVLPETFREDLRFIEQFLLDKGIWNRADRFKAEHIFLDKPERSKETHGVRIIDFDTDSIYPSDSPDYNNMYNFQNKNFDKDFDAAYRQFLLENGLM